MTLPTANQPDPQPFGAPPRPLGEDVLQSAEEAVLTNPASVDVVAPQVFPDQRAQESAPSTSYTDRVAACVARQPVQSALLAVAAGAFVAAAITAVAKRGGRWR